MSKIQVFVRVQMEDGEVSHELTWEQAEALYDLLHAALRKNLDKQPTLPTPTWPTMYRDGAAYTMKEADNYDPTLPPGGIRVL